MGGKGEVVFTALQKKSWLTLTSPLYSQLRSSFQALIFMAATFIVHNVYGEKCRGLAWCGSTKEDVFTQKSAVIAFVPPSFVCVSWGGLKAGDASRWWGEELLRIHSDLDEQAVWAYVELYAYSSPRTNNQLEGCHNCMKHSCMNKRTSISETSIWESTRQSGLKEDLNGILTRIETLFTGFLLLS